MVTIDDGSVKYLEWMKQNLGKEMDE